MKIVNTGSNISACLPILIHQRIRINRPRRQIHAIMQMWRCGFRVPRFAHIANRLPRPHALIQAQTRMAAQMHVIMPRARALYAHNLATQPIAADFCNDAIGGAANWCANGCKNIAAFVATTTAACCTPSVGKSLPAHGIQQAVRGGWLLCA